MGGPGVKHAQFCGRGKQHFVELFLRYGRETSQLGRLDVWRDGLKLSCICVIFVCEKRAEHICDGFVVFTLGQDIFWFAMQYAVQFFPELFLVV